MPTTAGFGSTTNLTLATNKDLSEFANNIGADVRQDAGYTPVTSAIVSSSTTTAPAFNFSISGDGNISGSGPCSGTSPFAMTSGYQGDTADLKANSDSVSNFVTFNNPVVVNTDLYVYARTSGASGNVVFTDADNVEFPVTVERWKDTQWVLWKVSGLRSLKRIEFVSDTSGTGDWWFGGLA